MDRPKRSPHIAIPYLIHRGLKARRKSLAKSDPVGPPNLGVLAGLILIGKADTLTPEELQEAPPSALPKLGTGANTKAFIERDLPTA